MDVRFLAKRIQFLANNTSNWMVCVIGPVSSCRKTWWPRHASRLIEFTIDSIYQPDFHAPMHVTVVGMKLHNRASRSWKASTNRHTRTQHFVRQRLIDCGITTGWQTNSARRYTIRQIMVPRNEIAKGCCTHERSTLYKWASAANKQERQLGC